MLKLLIVSISIFLGLNTISAQEKRPNLMTVGMSYGLAIPGGDLSDRYGLGFMPGISMDYILVEKKWMFTLEYKFLFGRNVKEEVYSPLLTSNGELLGNDGTYSRVLLRQRGGYLGVEINKVLPIAHAYSGLKIGMGFGILQHKIRLQVDTDNVPLFSNDYAKGYDRYTIGPTLKQVIGYQRIGTNSSMNYSIQFEIYEGFTKSNRPLDYDTKLVDDKGRLDIIFGLSAKWYLPIGKHGNSEEIFY